ncbi:MAG: RagB/SusD family nutrient uptake outer membrane protein, partial [Bacteroidales bacterium]|nr:RagB/SusD family nutrient uptake outer membrane protein [Bacteroidales bacterium]
AYAQDGNEADAKTILNELQSARKAVPTEGDLESIKKEWLRETVGDGQRINCIKRWGDGLPARPAQKAAENIVMNTPASEFTAREVAADSHTLVWPIPSYEIKISPALIQNPGYSAE